MTKDKYEFKTEVPQKPSWAELKEDLEAASSSDCLFNLRDTDSLSVSLDGTDEENQEKLKTAADFIKVVQKMRTGVSHMEEAGIQLEIAMIELQEAVDRAENQAEMAIGR